MTNFSWKTVMKYRSFFFGFAAIWIMFFHIRYMVGWPSKGIVSEFFRLGNIGVDIFLFFSAVGLSYSIESNTLKEFYKNRFLRLWVPFIVVCVPYYMWRDSVTGITLERVLCFLGDTTAINFWLKPKVPFWYVSLATAMYLVYPFLYRLYRKNKFFMPILAGFSIVVEAWMMKEGILTHAERGLSRIPIILLGIYLSDDVKDNKEFKLRHVIGSLALIAGIPAVFNLFASSAHVMYTRLIYGAVTVPILIVTVFVLEKLQKFTRRSVLYKFFCFTGTISLEVYLVHNAITRIIKYYDFHGAPAFSYYLWIIPLSIVISMGYSQIEEKIIDKINSRKGN